MNIPTYSLIEIRTKGLPIGQDLLHLNLSEIGLNDINVIPLWETLATFCTSLRILNLYQNGIGDSGIESLCSKLLTKLPSLNVLNLSSNYFTSNSATNLLETLSSSLYTNLQTLDISFNVIQKEPMINLGRFLRNTKTLTSLNLSCCSLTFNDITFLVKCLQDNQNALFSLPSLTSLFLADNLYLCDCDFQEKTIGGLVTFLSFFPNLRILDLSSIGLIGNGLEKLQASFSSNLYQLSLGNNSIGSLGSTILSNFLLASNHNLQTLHIDFCNINGQGLAQIFEAISKNSYLTSISMRGNPIGNSLSVDLNSSQGIPINFSLIFEKLAVYNFLEYLDLSGCRLQYVGLISLFSQLLKKIPSRKTGSLLLSLSNNQIEIKTQEEISTVLEFFLQNDSLFKQLDLRNNLISNELIEKLPSSLFDKILI